MDKATKTQIIGELKETFDGVTSVILADFRGIDVPTVTSIRHEFTKEGCGYKVLKNTLVKLAIKDSDMEPMSGLLAGPAAVRWTTDSPAAAAKLAVKFAKDEKHFNIKGGFFEGEVLDVAGVERLSKMPGKKELQATLLMTFIAAPTDFVKQIIAGPQNFMYLLDARKRSMEAGE